MSGDNRSVNSPLQRKSCTSTPDDITATFNSNQFWSYPFHNTEHLLPKTMNNSVTISNAKVEEAANNNDIVVQEDSVSNKVKPSPKPNDNVNKKENASSNVKTVTVPTNFNSLNELTEEELLILIEDRRKAAAAAEINIVPILSDGGYSRKSTPAANSEYSAGTKGSRRVSDTHTIKQDAAVDMRRKSLPSSKNFLQGFLQNFVLSGRKETSPQSPVETIKEEGSSSRQSPNINQEIISKPSPIENHRQSPNMSREVISKPSPIRNQNIRQSPIVSQESPIDLTVKHADLSPDEEVRVINAGVLQMEVSPDRDQDNNSSLNRTPVASGSCSRGHSRGKLAKTAAGTPKSNNSVANAKPRSTPSSPELQYPTDKDFGYVSPIPANELLNGTMTYSDSPKRIAQSPILSCSFTDPTYQYISDNSDNGADSSFEREFDSDLMSFEDPALEKSPFVKYTVELRAKLAARVSGDGPYKPSPFLFSPRNSSNPKVYITANDRHLHFLQEETTLDFENHEISEMIPQEEPQNEPESAKEIKVAGTVTEVSNKKDALVESSDVNDNINELGTGLDVVLLEKKLSKKTVWAQLVENIELHIIKGNKAGFIACLNGHSFSCV